MLFKSNIGMTFRVSSVSGIKRKVTYSYMVSYSPNAPRRALSYHQLQAMQCIIRLGFIGSFITTKPENNKINKISSYLMTYYINNNRTFAPSVWGVLVVNL